MGRVGRSLSACVAVLGTCAILTLVAMSAGAAGSSALPNIPSPPHIKLPKPDQTAVFDVVVEGKATDKLVTQMSGEDATCLVTEDGTVNDTTTYLRGRGVKLEFDRYGNQILIHRSGRKTDSTLAVKVQNTRTATGGVNYSPSRPGLPCSVPPFSFAENPDCGKVFNDSGAMQLTYEHHALGLTVTRSTGLGGGFAGTNSCGEAPSTGISEPFDLGWPNQPKLERAPAVTPKEVFGRKHAIVTLLRSSDTGKPKKEKRNLSAGSLTGSVEESAFNEATVRLIRQK
jgi:hypothetical protein